jgi:Protein of unknown function (DUF2628)
MKLLKKTLSQLNMLAQNTTELSSTSTVTSNSYDVPDEFIDALDETQAWKDRFKKFSHLNTFNNTKLSLEERKKLILEQKGKQKPNFLLNFNILAAFFTIFYFVAKGMWRRGLALLGFIICFKILIVICQYLFGLGTWADQFLVFFAIYMFAATANRSYYLFKVKNQTSWF